jgi:hypothetical protein
MRVPLPRKVLRLALTIEGGVHVRLIAATYWPLVGDIAETVARLWEEYVCLPLADVWYAAAERRR